MCGYGGATSLRLNVCSIIFTRPHIDIITANPISPDINNFHPFARSSGLAPPAIKYLNIPHINTINAIAKISGTNIPFMIPRIRMAYPVAPLQLPCVEKPRKLLRPLEPPLTKPLPVLAHPLNEVPPDPVAKLNEACAIGADKAVKVPSTKIPTNTARAIPLIV